MALSTQNFLEIKQIKEGIIILKNKGLRIVLMVSSLNFFLKSQEEQDALIYQFQNFLNSLDFSCQILIHSRRLNIIGYLDRLKEIGEKEKNELLKIQINDYHKFIEQLMGKGSIMQKTFYLVVPFSLGEMRGSAQLSKKKMLQIKSELTEEDFRRAKVQLMQRAEFVAGGLRGCGLQSVPLNTLEVAELFWSLHHPAESEKGYHPAIPPELTD